MNTEVVNKILEAYKQSVTNTREALRLAEVPESLAVNYTINLPEFDKLIPEDIVALYHDLRKLMTISLFEMGLTSGEIARRLGGNQYHIVWKILKEGIKNEKMG